MTVQLRDRLQWVLNAAARLIFTTGRTDHISPVLRDLQWLFVPERVKFRLCLGLYTGVCTVSRQGHGTPPNLADDICLTNNNCCNISTGLNFIHNDLAFMTTSYVLSDPLFHFRKIEQGPYTFHCWPELCAIWMTFWLYSYGSTSR